VKVGIRSHSRSINCIFSAEKKRRIARHHRLYNEERSGRLETKEDAATCYKVSTYPRHFLVQRRGVL
jgi:hypothetical protein